MNSAVSIESELIALEQAWAIYLAADDLASRKAFSDLAESAAELAHESLRGVTEAQPERGAAQLALGLHHGRVADQRRGTVTADQVTRQDWQAIHAHQEAAEPCLRRAIVLGFAPGMALTVLMRRQQVSGSRSAAEHLFDEVLGVAPRWLPAWLQIQGVREPRWGGTIKDMDALLALAPQYLSAADLAILTANHWWWRANYTATWDKDPKAALPLIEQGLGLDVPPLTRARLLDEKGAILSYLDRDAEAAVVTREAATLNPTALYYRNLAKRLNWAGDTAALADAYTAGAAFTGSDAYQCARQVGNLYAYDTKTKGYAPNRERALAGYERALELAEDDTQRRSCLNMIGLEWSEIEPADVARADAAFARAAALNDRYAAWNLIKLLRKTAPDDAAAQHRIHDLLGIAAEQGSKPAMRELADRIEQGIGAVADAQTASHWRQMTAYYGDADTLGGFSRTQLQAQDTATAEVAAWLAMAESDADIVPVRNLVNGLLDGTFGQSNRGYALGVVEQVLGAEDKADADLAVSRALLNYNALAPKERKPKATLEQLKQQQKVVRRFAKAAKSGDSNADVAAHAKKNADHFQALAVELAGLIRTMPGNNWKTFIWEWFGGVGAVIVNLIRGPKAWPAVRRKNWV